MIPYRKKLIEVALPLAKINAAAAREKGNPFLRGHPRNLHQWWARRPLPACRAVLFASLVDDPDSDPAYRKANGKVDEDRAGIKRAQLFNLIEELVQWANSNNPRVINRARAEIARCVASRKIELGELKNDTIIFGQGGRASRPPENAAKMAAPQPGVTAWEILLMKAQPEVVNAFLAEYAPPVLDPFCGGGAIPLEAQRLGLRAYASDLNPVAVLITKALIEIPPKFAGRPPVNSDWQNKTPEEKAAKVWTGAQGLAEDVRYYGKWMRDEAEKRIGHLYPKVKITKEMAKDRPDLKEYVGEELTVIAWMWARTVASPNPACKGAHVPLVRSFWLSTKKDKEVWVQPILDRNKNSYRFQVGTGKPPSGFDPKKGTVVRTGGRCLLTDSPMSFDHIRKEGKEGRMGARLMAIVAEGVRGRVYVSPLVEEHVVIAEGVQPRAYPDTDLPKQALSMRVMLYGMDKHYKLFTSRQLVALTAFSDLVQEAREQVRQDAVKAGLPADSQPLGEIADGVATYLGLGISRSTNTHCTIAIWSTGRDQSINAFGRQAIPMTWDFPEVNPFAGAAGDLRQTFESMTKVLGTHADCQLATVKQLDATAVIDSQFKPLISTDPPYYDNIGYADLSDFFYVWLRRSLNTTYPSLFATLLTPKAQELIATPFRHDGNKSKAQAFFEEGLGKAFARMRESHLQEFPLTLFYAFKQAETDEDAENGDLDVIPAVSTGWETMLTGLIRSGFSICGTWPIRTERDQGLKTGENVLASSIVLVCRPRPEGATLATRKQFFTALRQELPESLRNLQHGNIAPVDLAQAAIGPGMAIFTRYSKVMETDGSAMTVRTALGLINQALDEVLAEQEGEFDADTRWALAWFDQFGMEEGAFGVAETLSKAKNTAVNGLVEAGVVKSRAGKVQLVKRDELPADWDPAHDRRLTAWETTQHLIRTLDKEGEAGAAALVHKLGGMAETARDLAYRLYNVCERKKWADEALAYNGLVIAWPELSKLARSAAIQSPAVQSEMF